MELFDIIKLMAPTIMGARHRDYERVVKHAEKYLALVSGDNLDPYMRQFKRRESDDMFKQRKSITQHIVHSVCKNVRDIEYKIPRSNSIRRVISFPNDSEKVKQFGEVLAHFWGNASFSDFFDTRWIELNDTDPNSFLVIEWGDDVKPYPYEVSSIDALNYSYINNILQWMISQDGDSFTFYGKDESVKLTKVDKTDNRFSGIKKGTIEEVDGIVYVRLDNDDIYQVFAPPAHKMGEVPAVRVGYIRDQATKGRTYLTPWWAAEPILMNILQAKSEMDLTIALHAFPQKLQYQNRCAAKGCNDGFLPDGKICPTCKGAGYQIITSAQEAIILPVPKNKEQMIDLENLIKYVYPPVDLLKFQDDYIKNLSSRCMQLVYNSEIYSRKQVAETATGRNIDLQAIYDTLFPMVVSMSNQWEWGVRIIAKITKTPELIARFTYEKDFKLKTLEDYLIDLKLVKESEGAAFIKSSIEDDIARLIYSDDEKALARYMTKKRFNPFSGNSWQELSLKMNQDFTPRFNKVLWANYSMIFDAIERENPGFPLDVPDKQWEAIKTKVDEIMTTLDEEKTANQPILPPFNG